MMRARARCAASRSVAALAGAAAFAVACGGGGGSSSGGGPPYTVSGTILASASSAIDSDTNDPLAAYERNDSASQAQAIGNPVSLGGHVNGVGIGASGRTSALGDLQDWYRVSLAADQRILLLIAEDGSTNNLDLELRAQNQSLVASSATSSRTEEIVVPATGDYYVVVKLRSGASNYRLTIGQPPTPANVAGEPAFVPGEVLVRYRDDAGSRSESGAARARRVGMRHVSGASGGPMRFSARTLAERRQAFQALGIALSAEMRGAPGPRGARSLRDDTRRIVAAMRSRPEVRSADLNYLRTATAVPADEFYPFQWHFDQIHLPQAWDVTGSNPSVVVAVVDTGVKHAHPDLAGQLVAGYDFISDPDTANDGDGCDPDPEDPGDGGVGSSSFHGTHVTGTIAARTSLAGGNTDGVAGAAFGARVMPLRVLGVGGGSDADIMEALKYAAGRGGTCAGPGAATPARIVNMSLSGPGFSQTFQNLLTDLRTNAGMIFVAAAGNGASTQPEYPAAFAGVISVAAVGPTKALAPYSNYGSTIDVSAPGGDFSRDVDGDGFPDGVLSTYYSGRGFGYAFYQGTSMATPHVSGVLALMLGIRPQLTPVDIDNALNNGEITENIGSAQFFGHGLIDAARAVNRAAQGTAGATVLDPVLRVDPDGLNFGILASELHLSAVNGGNDQQPLNLLNVSFTSDDGQPWLTVTPMTIDAAHLGSYRAVVNRTGLANGLYTGKIHFDSDENDVDVNVIMQVGPATSAQADAGHHFILLVDPGTFRTVAIQEADAVGGAYTFEFERVQPGEYLIFAGTDSDGDAVICDAGEACGAFPTTDSVEAITIDSDRGDLRFVTGFETDVGAAAASAGASAERRGYSTRLGGTPPQ